MVKCIYNLRYFSMTVAEIKDTFDHRFDFFYLRTLPERWLVTELLQQLRPH
jgi:hypothetical protein